MTLQTTGQITLADVQTEFGGVNPISLSEYYAGGGYVPAGTSGTNGAVPASGTISLWNFFGTTALLDTQTVTVGQYIGGAAPYATDYGYCSVNNNFGSIVDGTSNIYAGAAIKYLFWQTYSGGNYNVQLAILGNLANSGWTTMTINGVAFARSAAGYTAGSTTTWGWTATSTNPFGTTIGAAITVTFS